MNTQQRVCVVGAGPCGLAAIKTLKQHNISYDCYELGSAIGGMWRFNNDNGRSAAYQSLHINTSRDRMSFSDFPMPSSLPDFPHHTQVLDYFESYSAHFGLAETITFETEVRHIQPCDDGCYDVTVQPKNGAAVTRRYEAVIIANGHHWAAKYPDIPGDFNGKILHSHDYRTPDAFRDQRVLVMGMGNSGCDIACETSRVSQRTVLSTRSGANVIPKYIFGKPLDRVAPGWMWRWLPRPLFQRMFALAIRIARGRLTRYGLPDPGRSVLAQHPTISSDLLNLIGHGKIHVRGDIEALNGDTVSFVDGSSEEFDMIVYATGYHIRLPFLDAKVVDTTDNRVSLYKHVVHPKHENLFFVGLVQPWGSIMPLAEQQALWICDLLNERSGLPTRQEMIDDIAKTQLKMTRRYGGSARHTIQVDFYPYKAAIESERRRKTRTVTEPASLSDHKQESDQRRAA